MNLRKYFNENTVYSIYCDMDSVLTDWNEATARLDPNFNNILTNKERWGKIDAEGVKFWSNMKWLKDGRKLWDYIKDKNVRILSSPGKNEKIGIQGKRDWLRKNISPVVARFAIIVSKDKKKNYSNRNSILIDDRKENIKGWISKGGIGILHKNTTQTIKELKELGI